MRKRGREKFHLSVGNELGPDQQFSVVWMREPFDRRKKMFSAASYGVDLMGVFIKGATHWHYQRGLIELRILS